ncbi:MAG: CPBP family intramembrane metalloprotease [Synergistaceae bacterium]|nr:CPBP family intramembrane metalloprotease [Synergistaceae bacterium]
MISLLVFAFFLYFPYGWCALRKESFESCGLRWKITPRGWSDLAIATMGTLLPLTAIALLFFRHVLPSPNPAAIFPAVLSGFAVAVAEETFFRGWLQTVLSSRFATSGAIFITAALFGLAHLASPYAPFALLAFFPGLVMGLLRHRHSSILPAILYHWFGNIWSIWFYPHL